MNIFIWSRWTPLFSGTLPRISALFPVFGYLILVNDTVSELLAFKIITGESEGAGLSGVMRLQLMYFGMFFLGIGSAIYSIRKPKIFELGSTVYSYVEAAFKHNTTNHYHAIRKAVISESKDADVKRLLEDYEWDAFYEDTSSFENARSEKGNITVERGVGSWQEAKNRYTDILKFLLEKNFELQDETRAKSLKACIFIGLLGYALLVIPSIDLFLKVIWAVFT